MKDNPLSEKELVNYAKSGDLESFEYLLSENQEYLKKWILSMCRGNELFAEEIFQITSIKAWKNIEKFKGDSKFRTWVCSISRNLFIDMKRKKDRRYEICLEIDLDEDGVGEHRKEASIETDPLKKFKNQELNLFLEKVLEKLSPDHSKVLRYFAVEQLSYEEIAKAMQCSIGTVMSRLFYARKKARKAFYQTERNKDYHDEC
tara:strand:- start:35 stop:643 length:609 start_codon:yes stop_codon:yes gene_type:complete